MDSSSSSSASSRCSFKLSAFDQNVSECLEKNPPSPISTDTAGLKNLPLPSWRKHKLVVVIRQKDDNEKFGMLDGEKMSANDRKKLKKISPSEKHRTKDIMVKETADFKVSLSKDRLRSSTKETVEQRSNRLSFESKRKAFYMDEGAIFKRYHSRNMSIIPEDVLRSPSPSSVLMAVSPPKFDDELDDVKEKKVTTKPPMKLGKNLPREPVPDLPKKRKSQELHKKNDEERNKKPAMKLGKSEATMRGVEYKEDERRTKAKSDDKKEKEIEESKPKVQKCPEEEPQSSAKDGFEEEQQPEQIEQK